MNEPTLHSHTHCQAAQANRNSQSLPISVSEPTLSDGRKKSTIAQQCIRAIAGEVVKSRTLHLINFCVGGKVIALKSATALIHDRVCLESTRLNREECCTEDGRPLEIIRRKPKPSEMSRGITIINKKNGLPQTTFRSSLLRRSPHEHH